ncbi:MAG: class I SAM-dependent methyltransferase [Chlorobiaceae bacterium]|nr:class I SAM-dependent methyltransferase [Chlorobiaceae bacterium]
MLQLKTASGIALGNLRSRNEFPPAWKTIAELEQVTDHAIASFLDERLRASKELGGAFLLEELADRALRTGEQELMDGDRLNDREKLDLVRALDRQNAVMQIYPTLIGIVLPLALEAAKRTGKDAHVLELAGGTGGFALALAEKVRNEGLPVRITGSDIVPAYIGEARKQAENRQLPVEFIRLDALDTDGFGNDACDADVVVLSQSLHHFTPGQLAVMISRSVQHPTSAFIGIDGYRSVLLAAGVPFIASLQAIPSFAIDGLISARKFYSEAELGIIAEIAAGAGSHSVSCSWPLSILCVRFGS